MLTENIKQAVDLLRDENLVWSNDFNEIKLDLANLLLASAAQGDFMASIADNFAGKLIHQDKRTSFDLGLEKR